MLYLNPKILIAGVFVVGLFSISYFGVPFSSVEYNSGTSPDNTEEYTDNNKTEKPVATHLQTPEPLKAIYMTSWVAGTSDLRNRLIRIADETEVNAIVIDIKDYSGRIAFDVEDPLLQKIGAQERRIVDVKELISYLHEKQIYVIGRITVFQDPFFAEIRPDIAVQKESDKSVWKDYKGLSFIDAGAEEYWEYILALSKESYELGFDELNLDYIRFPSDGNMKDIYYPLSEERILADPDFGKAKVIEEFFAYLDNELEKAEYRSGSGPVLSADLFGMVTTNKDDLNIGQVLERALPYFDYIAPMVYPSHYPATFIGLGNPNKYPYEVVKFSMDSAVKRLLAASSSPLKLRPWLQDFDYGGDYDVEEVQAQMQAVYDSGLTSWMLWDPSNVYTQGALKVE